MVTNIKIHVVVKTDKLQNQNSYFQSSVGTLSIFGAVVGDCKRLFMKYLGFYQV
jgi:hypothetical protein